MNPVVHWPQRLTRWAVFLFAAYVISGLVIGATLTNGDFHNQPRVAFGAMIYGEAHRPFVCRVLLPAAARVLTFMTPDPVKNTLQGLWVEKGLETATSIPAPLATEGVWVLALMHLSVLGFIVTLRELIQTFYDIPEFVATVSALAGGAALPVLRSFFMYDFAVALLFAAALLLMAQSRWRLYYAVFIAACFAKETAVLLPVVLLAAAWRTRQLKGAWLHVGAQLAIWAVVFVGLRYVYRDNPGQSLEFHLFDHNLKSLVNPAHLATLTKYLVPDRTNILVLATAAFFVFYRFKEKPDFLKIAVAMTLPLAGALLLFGWIEETRTYYEVLAVVLVLGQHTLMRVFDYPFANRVEVMPRFRRTGTASR